MFHFFKKNKENYWEIIIIIILQLCTKYFDMIYSSWDMKDWSW